MDPTDSSQKSTNPWTLTRRGLVVHKKHLKNKVINELKRELTVKPKTMSGFQEEVKPYKVYKKNDDLMCIPRHYGTKKFGVPMKKTPFQSAPADLTFKGTLRPLQQEVVDKALTAMREKGGGLVSLPCGYGKTVIALNIAVQMKVKTLVIVHKTFLQNQWYERIEQFTDARIGLIRQKKTDVEDKDIVVGMLQSISMIDYDPAIFDDFGLVIFDEVHHVASRVFSRALYKTGAEYTLGLSATLTRKDGLTKVIKWHLGDVITQIQREGCRQVMIRIFDYQSKDKKFAEKRMWAQGKVRPAIQKMINNLCALENRNKFLVQIMMELLNDPERKILLLSGRLKHLDDLKEQLDGLLTQKVEEGVLEQNEIKTAYYVGGMKEHQLALSSEADVIFATYAMAEEGLDIPTLNTLIFATSKSSITQSIGRILRKQIKEGDVPPLVVDIADHLSTFPNQAKKRLAHYRKNKYRIREYQVLEDQIVNDLQRIAQEEKRTLEQTVERYPELKPLLTQEESLKTVLHFDPEELLAETDESSDEEGEDGGDGEEGEEGDGEYLFI